jgi:hypothetical protein
VRRCRLGSSQFAIALYPLLLVQAQRANPPSRNKHARSSVPLLDLLYTVYAIYGSKGGMSIDTANMLVKSIHLRVAIQSGIFRDSSDLVSCRVVGDSGWVSRSYTPGDER